MSQSLTISVGSGVAAGNYTVKVRASAGGIAKEADLALAVGARLGGGEGSLVVGPTRLKLLPNTRGQVQLTLTPPSGFRGSVELSIWGTLVRPIPDRLEITSDQPVRMPLVIAVGNLSPQRLNLRLYAEGDGFPRKEAPFELWVATDPEPDPSFGRDGFAATDTAPGFGDSLKGLVQHPDGSFTALVAYHNTIQLVRYLPDGQLDTSFGQGGVVERALPRIREGSMLLEPNERLVVAGDRFRPDGSLNTSIFLARFNRDGTPDTSFDQDGLLELSLGGMSEDFGAIIRRPDGRLVGTGSSSNNGSKILLFQVRSDGLLDPGFGAPGTGFVRIDTGSEQGSGKDLVLLPSGDFLVASELTSGDILLTRHNHDGSLDPAFGVNGRLRVDLGAFEDSPRLLVDSNGRVVLLGAQQSCQGSTCQFAYFLRRYLANGALDASFGQGGTQIFPVGDSRYRPTQLLEVDGKLLTIGNWPRNGVIFRYHPDGSRDQEFGPGGSIGFFYSPYETELSSILVQPNGRLVVGGTAFYRQTSGWYSFTLLARYRRVEGLGPLAP
ncbi:hypothetical protein [Meiothermus sp. QL-1]|uniref:hypothetical protein n=1 Tax=Meiothermus sp. QL-1 TaxID=2058095 RepID=UPI0011C02886|nr:hypothetical protein [Meiothermus sp. QL-1]